MKRGIAFGVLIVAALALYQLGVGRGARSSSAPTSASQPRLDERGGALLRALPFAFIENQGQWDSSVRFITHKGGLTAWFEQDAITLQLAKREGKDEPIGAVLRLAFEGASKDAHLEGESKQSGLHNYFLGNDPAKWRTDVPGYAQVLYRGLYDGIDLQVKEHEERLEYDLLLKPDAELEQVAIRAEGVEELELAEDGSLLMHTALGAIHQPLPSAWHELASGQRQPVETRFVLLDKTRYGFEAPKRNRQLALVIDPGLVYSTYLGGLFTDEGFDIAVDAAGNVYVTGRTSSNEVPPNPFPITPGAYDPTYNLGTSDAFITKIDPQGIALVYSTFLGGSGGSSAFGLSEAGSGIAVDAAGNAYVTGWTTSNTFPTTPGAYDPTCGTDGRCNQSGTAYFSDAFITKLNPAGSALLYSTYLGGSGTDNNYVQEGGEGGAIAVDPSGNVYVTGRTTSADFPTTPGAFNRTFNGGLADAFVAKLNPVLSGSASLVYSTFLGGSGQASPPTGDTGDSGAAIAVDQAGSAYVTGQTDSANFPVTSGAFDPTFSGNTDAFVTKLNPQGSALLYSTFLGGTRGVVGPTIVGGFYYERGYGITVDSSGNVYITGQTTSSNFPTTPGAFDRTFNSLEADAFIAKLNPSASGAASLVYSTFLGGFLNYEVGQGIAVDAARNAYVTGFNDSAPAGYPSSASFPTTPGAYDRTFNGQPYEFGIFVTKLNAAGSALLYSTFLGPDINERGRAIAVDVYGNAYVTGYTSSANNFPTTPGVFQPTFGGVFSDAFVTKLDLLPTGANPYGASTSGGTGNCPGPITMGVSQMPQAGAATFALTAMNAPPNTTGLLGIAGGPPPTTPTPAVGINIWLNLSQLALLIPITSNSLGAVSATVPIPPGTAGALVHTQMLLFNTAGCGGLTTYSASNGLGLAIQP